MTMAMSVVFFRLIIFSLLAMVNTIIFAMPIKTVIFGHGTMSPLTKIERRTNMKVLFSYILSTMAGLCLVGGIAVLSGGKEY